MWRSIHIIIAIASVVIAKNGYPTHFRVLRDFLKSTKLESIWFAIRWENLTGWILVFDQEIQRTSSWVCLFCWNFAKLWGAPGLLENVLDSFSCLYIEIACSNLTFCATCMLSFLALHTISVKRAHPRVILVQVRIQDLVTGGGPASEAKSCRRSKVELCDRSKQSAAGVQGPLKGPGSFWIFNA